MNTRAVEWKCDNENQLMPGCLRIIDQTLLPGKLEFIDINDIESLWNAIKNLQVRGAPAIGVAAAMGIASAMQNSPAKTIAELHKETISACDYIATSRPTAVNLFRALDRIKKRINDCSQQNTSVESAKEALVKESIAIGAEDAEMCEAIGRHGASLLKDGDTIITHCNAGALATSGIGTALSPIYFAKNEGKQIRVYADETRPLLQGARLTAWELSRAGIDVTLICDNMAAALMKKEKISAVMVGADRIATNGDTANKIGTYGLAILAKHHKIPFYVLAPTSTFDMNLADGNRIPIEQRPSQEVTNFGDTSTAPEGIKVFSPAFDVTPAEYITAIVCEKGIAEPDFRKSLSTMV